MISFSLWNSQTRLRKKEVQGILWTLVSHVPLHYTLSNWLNTWLQKLTSAALWEVIKACLPLYWVCHDKCNIQHNTGLCEDINLTLHNHGSKPQSQQTYSFVHFSICSIYQMLIIKHSYRYRLWFTDLFNSKLPGCKYAAEPPDLRVQSTLNLVSHKGAWEMLQLRWQTVTHCASAYYTSTQRRRRILKANVLSL